MNKQDFDEANEKDVDLLIVDNGGAKPLAPLNPREKRALQRPR